MNGWGAVGGGSHWVRSVLRGEALKNMWEIYDATKNRYVTGRSGPNQSFNVFLLQVATNRCILAQNSEGYPSSSPLMSASNDGDDGDDDDDGDGDGDDDEHDAHIDHGKDKFLKATKILWRP